jgi:hypothetical protein
MRKFILLGSAALSLFAVGCTPSPEALCETETDTVCDRFYDCFTEAERSDPSVQAIIGTSLSDCKTKLAKSADCSSKKTDNDLCTGDDAGKTFNLSNASSCVDGIKKASCTDIRNGTYPAVCDQICK